MSTFLYTSIAKITRQLLYPLPLLDLLKTLPNRLKETINHGGFRIHPGSTQAFPETLPSTPQTMNNAMGLRILRRV